MEPAAEGARELVGLQVMLAPHTWLITRGSSRVADEVAVSLGGTRLRTQMMVGVSTAAVLPNASTVHGADGNRTALWRCTAGVRRELRLVARDAAGNACDAPGARWYFELRREDEDRPAVGLVSDAPPKFRTAIHPRKHPGSSTAPRH